MTTAEVSAEQIALDIAEAVMGNPIVDVTFVTDDEQDAFKSDIQIEAVRILRGALQQRRSSVVTEGMVEAAEHWFNANFNGQPDAAALVTGILTAALSPQGQVGVERVLSAEATSQMAAIDEALRNGAAIGNMLVGAPAPPAGGREAVAWPPIVDLGRVLGFFASVIKGGEPWTETCQQEYGNANAALQSLYASLSQLEALERERNAFETGLVEMHRELSAAEAQVTALTKRVGELEAKYEPKVRTFEFKGKRYTATQTVVRTMYGTALAVTEVKTARSVLAGGEW